ncbi:hypothetical protein SARC_05525 [Sphaeroforma arctica JP610]|uniref:Uncharacterized protein n=1 Tax=Sphaeroforma arctica JP610 TaxID=667725 RepID=A0A0L0G032_9EUKA|nr:hypothetical protein SARC_05525 [Sphaeroforma arctica JP610]KNC82186.1 hypothetical protein SARC_05525 [Sphaeroforma arctica JP610]|eukprot:XP_014156088.1 hypothetical protein SARC_05525 [Sphaeroforma arctica JP610]
MYVKSSGFQAVRLDTESDTQPQPKGWDLTTQIHHGQRSPNNILYMRNKEQHKTLMGRRHWTTVVIDFPRRFILRRLYETRYPNTRCYRPLRHRAVEADDLPRAEALRGVLETLRATHDSRPVTKHEPRVPRSRPEWPSNRYQLHNVLERDTKGALVEALKNAQISGLDTAWSLRWFYKVLSHFKAEQSTLDYIKSNQRLVNWTPELQITQICSHETQATVDPTFRKLAKGHSRVSNVPIMAQMTQLMENHRRAHQCSQTDAEFKQSLLNHCIVQLLEDSLGSRTYERTLQLHTKWHLMETHELLQLLSPDIQEAQTRTTA